MSPSFPRLDLNLIEVKHPQRGTSFFDISANKRRILLDGGAYSSKFGTDEIPRVVFHTSMIFKV